MHISYGRFPLDFVFGWYWWGRDAFAVLCPGRFKWLFRVVGELAELLIDELS